MPPLCSGTLDGKCVFRRGLSGAPAYSRPGTGTCVWCGETPEQSNLSPHQVGALRRALGEFTDEIREKALLRIPWLSRDAETVASIGRGSVRSHGSGGKSAAGSNHSGLLPRTNQMCVGNGLGPCVFNVTTPGAPTWRRQSSGRKTCMWCAEASEIAAAENNRWAAISLKKNYVKSSPRKK